MLRTLNRFYPIFLITALFVAGGLIFSRTSLPVHAQGALSAEISVVDVSAFPIITTFLDVRDADGQFVQGLSPAALTAIEDGLPVAVDSLEPLMPDVQLIVAVAPSPALATRDPAGKSRYDKIKKVIVDWASSRPADSGDDLSLVATGGSLVTHKSLTEWLRNFSGYQPDSRDGESGPQALNLALDLAEGEPIQPGMKRAILFISAYLPMNTLDGLESIAQRAKESNVQIFIWQVDSTAYLNVPGARAMRALAEQTGGKYILFTGKEELPSLEEYLGPLRNLYKVKYSSKVQTSGAHTLAMQVDVQGQQALSSALNFDANVEPPSAVLLSPPLQIVRETSPDDKYNLDTLSPVEQKLDVLIEFPDGHVRDLVRTTLKVNDTVVDENTSAPFDKFTWDLTPYTQSQQALLSVQVEDALGLDRSSLSVPVTITVVQPPVGVRAFLERNRAVLVVSAVVLAGVILLGVVMASGRIHLPSSAARKRERMAATDPVTQPVMIQVDRSKEQNSAFPWLRRKPVAAPAYLARLTSDGQPAPGAPIPLIGREMTFGTDPVQSTNILDDPTVALLHARIRQDERGNFSIFDQGSIAGTWVNYEQVSREGRKLEHGDTIHLGTLTFRFVLRKAPTAPRPRIIRETKE
jgi:hypothetical protein